jgi:hypothetical protein
MEISVRGNFLASFLILLLGLCTSCSCCSDEESSFRLHILRDSWDQLGLGGLDRKQAWSILKEKYQDNTALVITEEDIEAYNWSEQSILLTRETSDRLIEAFPDSQSWWGVEGKGFVVTQNGDWLYGGAFIPSGAAMMHLYPVIYIDEQGDQIVFYVRPFHTLGWEDYQDIAPSLRRVIEAKKVRDFFLEQGKLVE